MNTPWKAALLGVVALGCLVVPHSVGQDAPARPGWWIRIDPDLCEANSITFHVGLTAKDRDYWFTWRKGDAAEFELPAQVRDEWRVYLHAMANPDDREAWFCVYYKDYAVSHFHFDGSKSATMKKTDRDDDCR